MSRRQECSLSQSYSAVATHDESTIEKQEQPIITLLWREMEYLEVVSRHERLLPMPTLHSQWRTNIFEWFYKIIDHFVLHRAVVSVAMDYFDRFLLLQELDRINNATSNDTESPLAYSNATTNLKTYQLAAMTSLYIAMKVHAGNEEGPATSPWKVQRKTFSLGGFVKLSRGTFTSQDILSMELKILKVLEWKMNPVTPSCFLDAFMSLVPSTDEIVALETNGGYIQPRERYSKKVHFSLYVYYELARYLFELAMCIPGITPYFQTSYSADQTNQLSSSAIAFASASLAMDMMSTSVLSPRVRAIFLQRCMDIEVHPDSIGLSCSKRISLSSDANIYLKKVIHQNFVPEYVLGSLPGHDGKNPFVVACDMGMFTSIFSKTDVQPESPTSPIEEAAI